MPKRREASSSAASSSASVWPSSSRACQTSGTAISSTADLGEYHVPINADVPPIDIIALDEFDPHVNPLGAKGIGEIGITGVAGAIGNAVFHATGKRIRDLPITLDKII